MTPFVLLIGLGTHAMFEGLALGISGDSNEVLLFATAIVMHKGAAGMALGISMAKTFPDEPNFVAGMIVLFAVFTPIGVGFGMLLKNMDSDMIELIFACLAAGSFLYIACSEVIVEEFSISDYRFIKLAFFIIGIAIISSLAYLGDPEESCFLPEKCDIIKGL
jgi:solute carrier family 39 (zinc transporter), member 1/2/3